jgi:predicted metal-dependent peptidase
MKPLSKLGRARMRIQLKHPFFASLMLMTPMTVLPAGQNPDGWPYPFPFHTMATDMQSIVVSQTFIDNEDEDVLVFAICHELMHMAFEHGIRRGYRNPAKWNMAGDYVINPLLREGGFKVWENALIDDQYVGLSTEQVYHKLPNGPFPNALHDLLPVKVKELPNVERAIKRKVAQAAQMARMAGKLSGGLERFVNEILDPKVPWYILLRDYMQRLSQDEESWSKPNRRMLAHGYIMPSRAGTRMGEMIGIGDTSGSIGDEELKQYMGEYGAIAEEAHPERIRMVWWDTHFQSEQVFEDGEPLVPKPEGGGGTDMAAALEYVEKYNPEVVVLFTDGLTPWPEEEPPFPLIVCCTTDVEVPVGQVVRI